MAQSDRCQVGKCPQQPGNTKMSNVRIIFLVFAGLFMFAACGHNDTRHISFLAGEEINTAFQEVYEENELMGMSVLFIYNGNTVWEGYYGLSDSERRIPISDRTRYRIASISKMFAATALLQLWETGKVDLDTDVSQYLGWPLQHPKHKRNPNHLTPLDEPPQRHQGL